MGAWVWGAFGALHLAGSAGVGIFQRLQGIWLHHSQLVQAADWPPASAEKWGRVMRGIAGLGFVRSAQQQGPHKWGDVCSPVPDALLAGG